MKRLPRPLGSLAIKFLAAALMLIDHTGAILFPEVIAIRVIGRPGMPLFTFLYAEGARYTKNKLRYFLGIAGLSVVCQVGFTVATKSWHLSALVTFTVSVLLIFVLKHFKVCLFEKERRMGKILLAGLLFLVSLAAVSVLTRVLSFDYGFTGCMIPLFASIFDFRGTEAPPWLKRLDTVPVRALTMAIPVLVYASQGLVYAAALLGIIPLLFYSGKRGERSFKLFFYLFYPLHIVLLYGIALAVYYL